MKFLAVLLTVVLIWGCSIYFTRGFSSIELSLEREKNRTNIRAIRVLSEMLGERGVSRSDIQSSVAPGLIAEDCRATAGSLDGGFLPKERGRKPEDELSIEFFCFQFDAQGRLNRIIFDKDEMWRKL